MTATGGNMPVRRKVQASTAAAAVSGVVVWLLGRYVVHGALDAAETAEVYAAVPAVLTFAAGWLTRDKPPAVPPAVPASSTERPA